MYTHPRYLFARLLALLAVVAAAAPGNAALIDDFDSGAGDLGTFHNLSTNTTGWRVNPGGSSGIGRKVAEGGNGGGHVRMARNYSHLNAQTLAIWIQPAAHGLVAGESYSLQFDYRVDRENGGAYRADAVIRYGVAENLGASYCELQNVNGASLNMSSHGGAIVLNYEAAAPVSAPGQTAWTTFTSPRTFSFSGASTLVAIAIQGFGFGTGNAPWSEASPYTWFGIDNVRIVPGALPPPTAPVIHSQPAGSSILAGQSATLLVVASASAGSLAYQWFAGESGDDADPVEGAVHASFTTPPLSETARYWVRVTDDNGSTDSDTATVTVVSPSDTAGGTLVVDYGHDWGVGFYRDVSPQAVSGVDVNGNGSTADDQVRLWPFSLTEPLSPTEHTYDSQLPNARFYGGVYGAATSRPATVPDGYSGTLRANNALTEGHINQNHELRDDWNLMQYPSIGIYPELDQYEAAGLWLWKKEDFLNGGADAVVGFSSPRDYIAVFVSRYWGGVNWGRWVIRQDGQFYISEATFAGRTEPITSYGDSSLLQQAEILNPEALRASLQGDPHFTPHIPGATQDLLFDPGTAGAALREALTDALNDVIAGGVIANEPSTAGAPWAVANHISILKSKSPLSAPEQERLNRHYIDVLFAGAVAGYTFEDGGSNNPVTRTAHTLHPDDTRWAPYDPTVNPAGPRAMFFDWKAAPDFQHRSFDNFDMVGFLVQKDLQDGAQAALALSAREPTGVKWNAFQVAATVTPADPVASTHIDLVGVGGDPDSPDLFAARTEVTYEQWLRVFRWADSNQRARNFSDGVDRHVPPYSFERDGAIGSAEASLAAEHGADEPVTTISWYDAVIWCNALSELEGFEPAYYEDAAFTVPFREVFARNYMETRDARRPVYWKLSAPGYRLPTAGEWKALAAGATMAESEAWSASNSSGKTQPVATRAPNPLGLHDLFGNVAEYVWDVEGSVFDPAVRTQHTVIGGSFRWPEDENAASLVPFDHRPWSGTYGVGFRPVRNGGAPLDPGLGDVPERVIAADLVVPPAAPLTAGVLRGMALEALRRVAVAGAGSLAAGSTNTNPQFTDPYTVEVAGVETPYALWIRVKQWAESTLGYRFNFSGDMGSARHNLHLPRGPDEPVTQVSWFDAVVWCNALSELLGLDPVYRDAQGGVERVASPFRLTSYARYAYPNTGSYTGRPVDTAMLYTLAPDPARNGFRLPAAVEARAYGDTAYAAGDAKNRTTNVHGWFRDDPAFAGDPTLLKAMPAGVKAPRSATPGLHDILGNVQEWTYGGSSLFGQYRYGNDFGWSSTAYPHTMNRQDHVGSARPYLGFRVMRRPQTGDLPPYFMADPLVGGDAVAGRPYAGTVAGAAVDPNPEGSVAWAIVSGPAWLSVAADGSLSGTPAAGDIGLNAFQIAATGAHGLSATVTLRVLVHADDAPPPRPAFETAGWNLHSVRYWDQSDFFNDRMLSASEWQHNWEAYPFDHDERGYPVDIPAGVVPAAKIRLTVPGDYALTWTGEGADVVLDAPGLGLVEQDLAGAVKRRVYAKTAPASQELLARVMIRDQVPARDIRVWSPGAEPPPGADGEVFSAALLERLADNSSVIRFMDWVQANRADPTHLSWAQRRRKDFYTQQSPTAYEYMIELCNRANKDLWINIPHLADADYIARLAALIRTGMDDGVQVAAPLHPWLKVYVEWSNEVWNSLFPQHAWAVAEAKARLGLAPEQPLPDYDEVWRLIGEKHAEAFAIFHQVFGAEAPARVVRVLGTQIGGHLVGQHLAGVAAFAAADPDNAAGCQPDAVAVGAYFGHTLADWIVQQQAAGAHDWDAPTPAFQDAAFERLLEHEIKVVFTQQLRLSAQRISAAGLPMIAYEGGQHLVGVGGQQGIAGLTAFLVQMNRDARIGEMLRVSLDLWELHGGGLFMAWQDVGPYGAFGSWGFREFWWQTLAEAPKAAAYDHWMNRQQHSRILSPWLPDAVLGNPYAFALDHVVHAGPAGFTIHAGSLPQGITLGADGAIAGLARDYGLFPVTVQLADAGGAVDRREYLLQVLADVPVEILPVAEDVHRFDSAVYNNAYELRSDASRRDAYLKWNLAAYAGRTINRATFHIRRKDGTSAGQTATLFQAAGENAATWSEATTSASDLPERGYAVASFPVNVDGSLSSCDVTAWAGALAGNPAATLILQSSAHFGWYSREHAGGLGAFLEIESEPLELLPVTFRNWQKLHFGSGDHPDAAPDADPNRSGRVNLLEYALGADPNAPGGAAGLVLEPLADGMVSCRFPFHPGLRDIHLRLQTSSDLMDWDHVLFDSRIDGADHPHDWHEVALDFEELTAPLTPGRFFRLHVRQD